MKGRRIIEFLSFFTNPSLELSLSKIAVYSWNRLDPMKQDVVPLVGDTML